MVDRPEKKIWFGNSNSPLYGHQRQHQSYHIKIRAPPFLPVGIKYHLVSRSRSAYVVSNSQGQHYLSNLRNTRGGEFGQNWISDKESRYSEDRKHLYRIFGFGITRLSKWWATATTYTWLYWSPWAQLVADDMEGHEVEFFELRWWAVKKRVVKTRSQTIEWIELRKHPIRKAKVSEVLELDCWFGYFMDKRRRM